MHIISRSRIRDFSKLHQQAAEPLDRWYRIAKKAAWVNFAEVKNDFPAVDLVGVLFIFDIGGNKFRLIAEVSFERHKVWIRHILTHAEYDKLDWK